MAQSVGTKVEKSRIERMSVRDHPTCLSIEPLGGLELLENPQRPRRSLAEALMDFPNTVKSFPIEAIFELFPLIRPRPYSICSHSENYVEILCAVVKYRSRMGEYFRFFALLKLFL